MYSLIINEPCIGRLTFDSLFPFFNVLRKKVYPECKEHVILRSVLYCNEHCLFFHLHLSLVVSRFPQ